MTDEIFDGNLDIQNKPPPTGKTTIKLLGGKLGGAGVEATGGAILIGGENSDGTVNFFPKAQLDPFGTIKQNPNKVDEITTIRILGDTGTLKLHKIVPPQFSYTESVCQLSPTSLKLFKDASHVKPNQASIYADGYEGDLWIGGNGTAGNLYIFPKNDYSGPTTLDVLFESDINTPPSAPANHPTVVFDGENAHLKIGGLGYRGNGRAGRMSIYPEKGAIVGKERVPFPTIEFTTGFYAEERLGGYGQHGKLKVYSKNGLMVGKGSDPTIVLDGEKGDINLANADCAEDFSVSEQEPDMEIEPGTVMVIDDDGKLQRCSTPYDTRVAGVISGACNCKPGIVLGKKQNSDDYRLPLALMGKVNCKVDASYSNITVGDMLTTSRTEGYAMKATNRRKSFGSIIGKALKCIEKEKAIIPILIALQ